MPLPDPYPIIPISRGPRGSVRPPGSKSYSNRALPTAAAARGRSVLTGLLDSEDTRVMLDSLQRLGVVVAFDEAASTAVVDGCGGHWPATVAELHLANSGTSIRFLAAMLAAGHGEYRLDGVARMRQRPIGDLLEALTRLGVDARSEFDNGCPPITIRAAGLAGGVARVRGDVSSQFLSGLLLAAPLAAGPITIEVDGELVSRPYIDLTLGVMSAFGAHCEILDERRFHFARPGGYTGRQYAIEPDASSASYFLAAAAITRGEITIEGLGSQSRQGDLRFAQVLQSMGCDITQTATSTTARGGPLHGIDVNMGAISDTVPTLAATACFADGPTVIRDVAHIRHKECDRISAVVTELRKLGVAVEEREDGMSIHPGAMTGAMIDTYNDHRMAMSFSLVGLRVPGVLIRDPGCTAKTYPRFFNDLERVFRAS